MNYINKYCHCVFVCFLFVFVFDFFSKFFAQISYNDKISVLRWFIIALTDCVFYNLFALESI